MHENKRKTVCRIKKYLIVDLSFIRIFKVSPKILLSHEEDFILMLDGLFSDGGGS